MSHNQDELDAKEEKESDFKGGGEVESDVLLQEKPTEKNSADSHSLVRKPRRCGSFVRGGW